MAPLISNVSDTARWVAVYRAWESERADALFSDPLAAKLAGEQGHAIATSRRMRLMGRGAAVVARTKLIDDLIATALKEGCDRVLNLAAGFDARPYRLELPATLDWVEADLPAMVDEKEALLKDEAPRCRLYRERVDLADPAARAAFLARATAGARRTLVISEGLVCYLRDSEVAALARDLLRPEVAWWVLDVLSPWAVRLLNLQLGLILAKAPMRFAPPEGVAFFERLGWKTRELFPIGPATARFARRRSFVFAALARLSEGLPMPRNLWSNVVCLEGPAASGVPEEAA